MDSIRKRLAGELPGRPLHSIFIVDCSASMAGHKMQSLNYGMHEALPALRKAAVDNPEARTLLRVIKSSDSAHWITEQPTPVHDFQWKHLIAGGSVDMGKALAMVGEKLRVPPMEERGLPPVLVLFSNRESTDDFSAGLKALTDQPWRQNPYVLQLLWARMPTSTFCRNSSGIRSANPLISIIREP